MDRWVNLESRFVTMRSTEFEDPWLEYTYRLVCKEEKRYIDYDYFIDTMNKFCKASWVAYYDGDKFGVGLVLNVNGQWIIEGLKDRRVKGVPFAASIEAGRLMVEEVEKTEDVLFTYARVEQRAIQYLCEKLGFTKIDTQQSLVVYRKEKVCQSFQRSV